MIEGEEKRLKRDMERKGIWMRDNKREIREIKWVIIGEYEGLMIIKIMKKMKDRM